MSLLWAKQETTVDAKIMAFTAGDDVILDRQLFAYDIQASQAHVAGLARVDVLRDEDAQAINKELQKLLVAFEAGEFMLDERFEDGHSAIENHLTSTLGELGKRVHTGRSRNDQVLVASRLLLKDALKSAHGLCVEIARVCLDRAEETMMVPMAGYTHLQRAVPSSVGMWFAAFAETFVDGAFLVASSHAWIDANPLGTAAGYGVNIPLDREFTTEELGFGRTQWSPIYAQNSRGKFELQVIDALGQLLLDVRRMAWDLSLFTTAEFAFVELPDAYTTGSSIMPNKRNPDVVELLRAAYGVVAGARAELASLLGLPSGYHRDLQNTKAPTLRAIRHSLQALALIPELLNNTTFNSDTLEAAMSEDLYATDIAVELSASGIPFREAYRIAAAEPERRKGRSATRSLEARVSPGGAADPRLDRVLERLDSIAQEL